MESDEYKKGNLSRDDAFNGDTSLHANYNRGTNPYAEGTRYYDLWESNPYRESTLEQTHWDAFLNTLGIRTSYDIKEAERIQAMKEYDAQIAQLKGEDEYNTPEAQAERMRAAGQNPDLLGTEGVSPAGEFAQEQTTPDLEGAQTSGKAAAFVGALGQIILGGIGMTKDIAGALGLFEELKTKRLQNAGKIEELADKFLVNYAPERKDEFDDEQTLIGHITGYADLFAENNHLNKKQKAQFINAILARYGSQKGMLYDRDTKTLKARKEYGLVRGNKYTPQTDEIDGILKITGTLAEKLSTAEFHSALAESRKAKNEADKEGVRNGTLEGEAENAQNEVAKQKGEFTKQAREAVQQALYLLKPYMDNGNLLAITLGSALPALQLKFLQ